MLGWCDCDLCVVVCVFLFVNFVGNCFCFCFDGFDSGWVDVGLYGECEFVGLGVGDYIL